MVFPAQSGSKLWPSLCALGTRPTAIPILSLAFPAQSCLPPPLPSPKRHFFNRLSTSETSCSHYSDIWEPETSQLLYEQHGHHSSGGNEASFTSRRGKEAIRVSCLVSLRSSKTAERRLTCVSPETFPFTSAVQLVSVPPPSLLSGSD